ncbi:hypothetical protein D7Z26_26855 [Cohnella endophytica]|uniref:SLH domain-containing protein n=1 Tax=Cohnella endophytica TaxID=2419778 RepID=A0A494X0L2_9BACL|nr:Ig-like domain-containing protein [Cohnella endophytica]RKP44288.1 hypothetical protein D7Z26_26855 [Cohnella endophytica]
MRKTMIGLLALLMLISVPYTANGASNLSTEQKFDVLKQKNIFTGYADGSSHLYDPMSREQLAAVLFRLLDLPGGNFTSSYGDVLKTRWSFLEIEAVTRAKLMGGTSSRIFSPLQNVTVEQLAAVFTRSYGLYGSGSTPVTGKVSKWARGAVGLALDRKLIPQLSDYTIEASRGLLVEAAYAVYEDNHTQPLRVRSVEQLSNQSVRVNLYERGDKIELGRFALKDTYGNTRAIQQAIVGQDGLSIILWTDRQIGGITHTLYVDGNPWNYVSVSDDTTKPTIISQPTKIVYKTYEIVFSEPVDQNSATNSSNYSLSDGLRLASNPQLSSDLRRVTFTTTDQSNGKTYRLTVRNVKDLAGNVMDQRSDLYFVGSNDNTKPTVTEVKIDVTTAVVSVKFSEKIDPQQAVQTYHYAIDKGLAVTQATLGNDGTTVYLRTSQQQDATVYMLTVSGIPDLAGNVMDNSTNWKFGAVSNPIVPIKVQNIKAINKNTIEVTFDRPLSNDDINRISLAGLKDNGSDVNLKDWADYAILKPGTDRTATIQFRTKESNPALFLSGHLYTARIAGLVALQSDNNSDQADFGGTVVDNPIPFASQTYMMDRKTVKVVFSEPVTNVNVSAFRIREKGGDWIDIAYVENGDPKKIVTEVVLKLSNELKSSKVYELSFQSGITDAATWNGLKTMDGAQPYVLNFNS